MPPEVGVCAGLIWRIMAHVRRQEVLLSVVLLGIVDGAATGGMAATAGGGAGGPRERGAVGVMPWVMAIVRVTRLVSS